MYEIIRQIINHAWVSSGDGMQAYIVYVCSVLIPVLTVVFIDMVYRVFRHFWRR